MDPALRDPETSDNLLFDIDDDRGFQEMFPDFTGSFGVIMAAVSAGEPGRIDGGD